MNEEMRQVKVVEFCEALTKRIRTAIAVLGGFAPGANAEFHKLDNNVIRLQVNKRSNGKWLHTYTLDNGEVHEVEAVDMTEAESYATERFHNYVFQQNGLYRNGDIHFTKCEIDRHPAGLSTGFNPFLEQSLRSELTWSLFETVLTEKMKWYTQVHRAAWNPAKTIQQGFDQDKKLASLSTVTEGTNGCLWCFHWNDGTVTSSYQDLSTDEGIKIYNKITNGIIEKQMAPNWLISYLKYPW